MSDSTQYAPTDVVGRIRQQLFRERADAIQYGTLAPGERDRQEFLARAPAIAAAAEPPQAADVLAFERVQAQIDANRVRLEDDVRRGVSAQVLGDRAATEQEQQTLAGRAMGGVGALLDLLDTPRRWTFDTLVRPRLEAAGLPAPSDSTGRALLMDSLGGKAAMDGLAARMRESGINPSIAQSATEWLLPGAAGLAVDVLMDPLSYASLGTTGVLKQGGRALAREGIALRNVLKTAPTVTPEATALLRAGDDVERLGVLAARLGGRRHGDAKAVAAAVGTELRAGAFATSDDVLQTALGALGEAPTGRAAELADTLRTTVTPAADHLDAVDAVTDALLNAGIPKKVAEAVRALEPTSREALATAPTRPLAMDAAFANLRAFGADDLFERGGLQFRLPKDWLGVHLPLLNPEERLGVFVGGREITVGKRSVFDSLLGTARTWGGAALARVPVVERTGERLKDNLGEVLVPFHWLAKPGFQDLIEKFKTMARMPATVREETARDLSTVWNGVTDQQKADLRYILDQGIVARDEADDVIYETLDEAAERATRFNQDIAQITHTPVSVVPTEVTGPALQQRFEAQQRALRAFLDDADAPALNRVIEPEMVTPAFREDGEALTTAMTAADVVTRLIDRATEAAETYHVAKRIGPYELVGRPDFANKIRDPHTRRVLEELVTMQVDEFGQPLQYPGAIGQILRHAQENGQETFLEAFVQHIYKPTAAGVGSAVERIRRRVPSNLRKQRIASYGATPEEQRALGYLIDPQEITTQTLARYRIMARQRQFVDHVLQQYGRKEVDPHRVNTAVENFFDPDTAFRKQLPDYEELAQRALAENMEAEELAALPFRAAPKPRGAQWVIPNEVIRALNTTREVTSEPGILAAALDNTLAVLRGMATVIHPGYHVRNVLGAQINSAMGGVPLWEQKATAEAAEFVLGNEQGIIPRLTARALWGASVVAGGPDAARSARSVRDLPNLIAREAQPNLAVTGVGSQLDPASPEALDWLRRYWIEHGILRNGETRANMQALDKIPSEWATRAGQFSPLAGGRTAGEVTDNIMRVRHVLGRVYRGDTLEEATLSAKRYLFDYSDMTEWERNVFGRLAFFYNWCLRDTAEALTRDGWRTVDNVRVGDEILTHNTTTGRNEWQLVQELGVFDYNGELFRHAGKSLDVIATPNHRHVVADHLGRVTVVEGYKLRSNDRFVFSAPLVDQPDHPIPDDVLVLIGWLVTDGHIGQGQYRIYQAPTKFADEIRRWCGGEVTEYVHPQTGVVQFVLRKTLRDRVKEHLTTRDELLPLVTRLSARQRTLLRDAMYKAEGSLTTSGFKFFAQQDPVVLSAFQTLCALDGVPFRVGKRGGYIRSHTGPVKFVKPEVVWFTGRVWCPVTPNGTWVARDNGHVFITGNTRRNIPLQVEMMLKRPANFARQSAALRLMEDPEAQQNADAALMPAWMREQLGVVLGTNRDGSIRVLTGMGLPIEDLNLFLSSRGASGVIEKLGDMTNPLARWALDLTGRRTGFTGAPVDDPSLQNYYRRVAPLVAEIAQVAPAFADWIGLEEREIVDAQGNTRSLYTGNPWKLYVINNLFGAGRTLREIGDVGGAFLRPEPGESPGEQVERQFFATAKFFGVGSTTKFDITRPIAALHTSTESQELDADTNQRLDTIAQQFIRSEIRASQWRALRGNISAERAHKREQLLTQQLNREAANIPEDQLQVHQAFRDRFVPEGQRALDLIFDLNPEGVDPTTNKPFASPRQFIQTRQAAIAELRAQYPDAYKRYEAITEARIKRMPETAQQVERLYQRAVGLLEEYERVPKYRNLNEAETALADEAAAYQRGLSSQFGPLRARRATQEAYPEGSRLLRRAAPNRLARQRAWRRLNDENDQLLNEFFRDLPISESLDDLNEAAPPER